MIARRALLFAFVSLLAVLPLSARPNDSASAEKSIAIIGVNVLPMDSERVLADQTVIVTGARITAIGPAASTKIPDGATRIEARGKYLLPGLTEMHGHIPPAGALYSPEDVSFLYLSRGVTTVRGMLGHPTHLTLRDRIRKGEVAGPTYYLSGPAVAGNSPVWGTPKTAEDGVRIANEIKKSGYEAVKIHEGVPPETFNALIAEAHRLGLYTGGHVPNDVTLENAIAARMMTVEHLDGWFEALEAENSVVRGKSAVLRQEELINNLDLARLPALAARMKELGIANVPTTSLYKNIFSPTAPEDQAARPEVKYAPKPAVQAWITQRKNIQENGPSPKSIAKQMEVRNQIVRELQKAGAVILLGSDSPQIFQIPGFSLHNELADMVQAGLTPAQALAAGTRAPGNFFSRLDRFGTVTVGSRADLILANANPLENVAALAKQTGVMAGGRWYPQAELQKQLDAIAAKYAAAPAPAPPQQ